MAVLVTTTLPAQAPGEPEQWHERNLALPQHQGFIFQCDGPVEGGWQIVSAWDSQETFQRYFDEVVRPNIPPGMEASANMQVRELASVVSK